MTTQTTAQHHVDEYEDLTRFADENFDTDEVDLFQFSGNSETSPLTRLKSVILSLEWEITDEYLQELAEELAALAPSLQDDKIANLYLQGMGKIGKYLRLRGAHAHANAIKLLLRYFYDFETILNSPDMDNDRITRVVQNDVRMFRILQYQIKLSEETAEDAEGQPGMAKEVVRDTGRAGNALRAFKAAVLELDWEVNDTSLQFFADALKALSQEEIQNKSALILIQGMQALGQYISEERAHAHPEVFNLLHAFHDGLERILDTGPSALDQKQKKRILVDRINRLNHLKKLIAPQDSEVPEAVPLAQAVAAAQAREAAAETPAPEPPAAEPAPSDDVTPALADAPAPEAPVDEEPALFDDVTPALADAPAPEAPADEEPALFDDVTPALADAPAPEAPAEEEPALFDDVTPALADAPAPEMPADEEPALFDDVTPALADAPAPAAAIPGVIGPDDDYDDDEPALFGGVKPALADAPAGEPALFDDVTPALSDEAPASVASLSETEMEKQAPETGAGIAAEIDDLFSASTGTKRAMLSSLEAYPDEVLPASAIQAVDDEVSDGFIDSNVGAHQELAPALEGAVEEDRTATEGDAELDEQLDMFFGESTEEAPPPETPAPAFAELAPAAEPEPATPAPALAGVGDDDDEDELDLFPPTSRTDELPSALADADVPEEEQLELGAEDAELSAKLDSFFDFPTEPAPAAPEPAPAPAEETLTLDGDLFGEEPAAPVAPAAMADDADVLAFAEDELPAASEEEGGDTLFVIDEPAAASPSEELFAQEPAAPAIEEAPAGDEALLFAEEPAAPAETSHEEMPSALADAEVPAEEEGLAFEADEELSAHLDSFFGADEPAPEPPAAPAETTDTLALDETLFDEAPAAPVAEETAAPADDMLLFEEEPAADAHPGDMALFGEESPAAPATDDTLLFAEEPAAPAETIHEEMPSALADAEAPADEETLTFEADEELSAHLDSFFGADEPAPEAPAAPVAEPVEETLTLDQDDTLLFADEPAAPAAEESPEPPGLFLDESDLAAEAPAEEAETTLFADEPAAPAAEESPEPPGLFLDESDLAAEAPAAEAGTTLFADEPAAPAAEESPAEEPGLFLDESDLEAEAAQPAAAETAFADGIPADEAPAPQLEPEEDREPKVFEDVVAALADVEPGKSTRAVESDAGFQDQLDSFFGTTPEEQDAPPPPPEEEALVFHEPSADAEPALAVEPADDAADTLLFDESEAAAAPAPEAEPVALVGEGGEEPAEPSALAGDEGALQLEKTTAPVAFDDLVDSDEVHDFLVSGGDIEDISDEELALVEEEEATVQVAPEAPPVAEALAGAFDEPAPAPNPPLFGEEEEGTLAAMDDLFGVEDESLAPSAPESPAVEAPAFAAAEDTASLGDVVADESVLFADGALDEPPAVAEVVAPAAEPEPESPALFADGALEETEAEAVLAFPDEAEPTAPAAAAAPVASGMGALAESLPALIAGYTAEQLNACRRQLEDVRQGGGLSPVQQAAAGMLESVLAVMPAATAHTDTATASLLEGLYGALTEPQDQLPIQTVTAYSAWVRSQVTTREAEPAPVAADASRDLFQELSAFRSRMERELAELREELRKK